MIDLTNESIKFNSLASAELWLKLKGFSKVRGIWISKSKAVLVTRLLNDRVSIQIGVPA